MMTHLGIDLIFDFLFSDVYINAAGNFGLEEVDLTT